MDITERLNNWAQYATTGQKLVIIDAKNEIERLREEVQDLEEIMEKEKCAVGYLITKRVLKQHGAWKQKESE